LLDRDTTDAQIAEAIKGKPSRSDPPGVDCDEGVCDAMICVASDKGVVEMFGNDAREGDFTRDGRSGN
jgi:hypothetical protein